MTDDEIAVRILALDEGERFHEWLAHWAKKWPAMKSETVHSGDCTKQPWSCLVCCADDIRARILDYRRAFLLYAPEGWDTQSKNDK